jgi:AsmA protein
MKYLKYLLFVILGVVVVIGSVLGYVIATFNPNDYKAKLTEYVHAKTQRTLTIEGEIKLHLFPRIGVGLGKTRLSEPRSEREFAAIGEARVSLALLPLLSKHVVVDEVTLSGLRLNLVRYKNGKTNFDDLTGQGQTKPQAGADKSAPQGPVNIAVAGVAVTDAALSWKDEQAGAEYTISRLNLKTGNLGSSSPANFEMSLHAEGKPPAVNVDFSASGKLLADMEKNLFRATAFEAKLTGTAADVKNLLLTVAGDIEAEPDKKLARLNQLKLSVAGVQGNDRLDVKLGVAKAEANPEEIGVNDLLLTGTADYAGIALTEMNVKAASMSAGPADIEKKLLIHGLSATVKGKKQDDAFEASVDAPRIDMSKGKIAADAISVKTHLQGKERSADATLKIAAVDGSTTLVKIGELALTLDAKQGTDAIKASLRSPVSASVKGQSVQLSKLAAEFIIDSAKLPKKTLKLPLSGEVSADALKESFSANLLTQFDDSAIKVKAALTNFKLPQVNIDLSIDKLNLDRYLPPAEKKAEPATATAPSPAQPEQPIDLSALKMANGSATIRIGDLTVHHLKIANLSVEAKLQGGKLEVSPFAAALYQGSVGGTATVDANGNKFAVKQNLVGVALGPLLQDYMQKDLLEGKGNVMLNVTTQGSLPSDLRKALNGSAKVDLKNGAFKGIDLDEVLRNPKELLVKKDEADRTADRSKKTSFTELGASFDIKSGVAHNEDLVARTQTLKLSGAGDIDVGAGSLNYLAKASAMGTKGGEAKAATLPVRISGPFDAMKFKLDLAAFGSEALKQTIEKKKEEIKDKVKEQAAGKVKDKLKGLLKN